jgi:hypothetical protein
MKKEERVVFCNKLEEKVNEYLNVYFGNVDEIEDDELRNKKENKSLILSEVNNMSNTILALMELNRYEEVKSKRSNDFRRNGRGGSRENFGPRRSFSKRTW